MSIVTLSYLTHAESSVLSSAKEAIRCPSTGSSRAQEIALRQHDLYRFVSIKDRVVKAVGSVTVCIRHRKAYLDHRHTVD